MKTKVRGGASAEYCKAHSLLRLPPPRQESLREQSPAIKCVLIYYESKITLQMQQFSDKPITRFCKDKRCCCKELAVRLAADQRKARRAVSSHFQSRSRSEKS